MRKIHSLFAGIAVISLSTSVMAQTQPDTTSASASQATTAPTASSTAQATPVEVPPAKKLASVAVVANPLGLLFGFYNVDVGVAVTDKLSANFAGHYWSLDFLGVETKAWGAGIGAQYFFYGNVFQGAFVYPALEIARTSITIGDFSASGTLFGPSAIVGYQWNFHPFTVRVGGGGQYLLGDVSGQNYKSSLQGIDFKLDGSIGLAF